jgi:hypothetical protein
MTIPREQPGLKIRRPLLRKRKRGYGKTGPKAACPNLMFPVSGRELAPSNRDI